MYSSTKPDKAIELLVEVVNHCRFDAERDPLQEGDSDEYCIPDLWFIKAIAIIKGSQ